MLKITQFKAAAIQTSPVFLDTTATIKKACKLIEEASDNGASLVAFPEVFVSAYPYWNWLLNPVQGSKWFEKLYLNSVDMESIHIKTLCKAAKKNKCDVVIGINEKDEKSIGTLYNTTLIIDTNGDLIGKHRKLVPTWAEKLTWTGGDGSSLKVYNTKAGTLGVLACGENTNMLARYALLAQGERIHIANYISLPIGPIDYDMATAIKIRAMGHSFEGKIFTIVSCSTISEDMIQFFETEVKVPEARALFERKNSAFSGIIDPQGHIVGEPLIDKDGIVYANIDLKKCIQPKQMHDITGHYNRFDIFDLKVNTRTQTPATFSDKKEVNDIFNNFNI